MKESSQHGSMANATLNEHPAATELAPASMPRRPRAAVQLLAIEADHPAARALLIATTTTAGTLVNPAALISNKIVDALLAETRYNARASPSSSGQRDTGSTGALLHRNPGMHRIRRWCRRGFAGRLASAADHARELRAAAARRVNHEMHIS